MSKLSFADFKNKNEGYFKELFKKNKKLFKTKTLSLDGKVLSLEELMLKAYLDEYYYEEGSLIRKIS